jgi:TetR/AcrR family transcriptional regulator, fatty acid biosynthesis regulator
MAPGKRLLMDAAARLAARHSSADMVSLRELAREAGLNHNTFYRHFESQEDLLHAIVEEFSQELRQGLAQARLSAPSPDAISHHAMDWLLDFALAHRDVFIVSMRERFGPPGPLQTAVTQMMAQLEADMLRELSNLNALPPLPQEAWQPALRLIAENAFQQCLAHIQDPSHKALRLQQSKTVFDTVVLGTFARLK